MRFFIGIRLSFFVKFEGDVFRGVFVFTKVGEFFIDRYYKLEIWKDFGFFF